MSVQYTPEWFSKLSQAAGLRFCEYQAGPKQVLHEGKWYVRIDVPCRNFDGTRSDYSFYQRG